MQKLLQTLFLLLALYTTVASSTTITGYGGQTNNGQSLFAQDPWDYCQYLSDKEFGVGKAEINDISFPRKNCKGDNCKLECGINPNNSKKTLIYKATKQSRVCGINQVWSEKAQICSSGKYTSINQVNYGDQSDHISMIEGANSATGNLFLVEPELKSDSIYHGIPFSRFYNSSISQDIGLGAGWSHSYSARLNIGKTSIKVTRPDGQSYRAKKKKQQWKLPDYIHAQLKKNSDNGWTLAMDRRIEKYNTNGLLTSVTFPGQSEIKLSYKKVADNKSGKTMRLDKISQTDTSSLQFGYQDNRLSKISSNNSDVANFIYKNGLLKLTNNQQYKYSQQLPKRITSRTHSGKTQGWKYDQHGRVSQITRPGNSPIKLRYLKGNKTRIKEDAQRQIVSNKLDSLLWYQKAAPSKVVSKKPALGLWPKQLKFNGEDIYLESQNQWLSRYTDSRRDWLFEYNSQRLEKFIQKGKTITYQQDETGRFASVKIDGQATLEVSQHTEQGLPATLSNSNYQLQLEYDNAGRLISAKDPTLLLQIKFQGDYLSSATLNGNSLSFFKTNQGWQWDAGDLGKVTAQTKKDLLSEISVDGDQQKIDQQFKKLSRVITRLSLLSGSFFFPELQQNNLTPLVYSNKAFAKALQPLLSLRPYLFLTNNQLGYLPANRQLKMRVNGDNYTLQYQSTGQLQSIVQPDGQQKAMPQRSTDRDTLGRLIKLSLEQSRASNAEQPNTQSTNAQTTNTSRSYVYLHSFSLDDQLSEIITDQHKLLIDKDGDISAQLKQSEKIAQVANKKKRLKDRMLKRYNRLKEDTPALDPTELSPKDQQLWCSGEFRWQDNPELNLENWLSDCR